MYEKAFDSEPEVEEEDTNTKQIVEQEQEKQQQKQPLNKIKTFSYLNKNAKRNRR